MTNAIEQTRREMYDHIASVKLSVTGISLPTIYVKRFEEFLEMRLEELRKDRAAIAEERDTLRNKLQALQMASSTAAEVIRGLRSELEEAREGNATANTPQKASEAVTIIGAVTEAQRIMTDWLVPHGISAKKAMSKIVGVLDNEPLFMALRSFEKNSPLCKYCDGLGYVHCNGGRPTAPCPEGCQ